MTRCRTAAPAPALQPRCWFLIAERSGTGRPDQRYCPLGSSRQLLFGNTYLLAPPTVPGEQLQRARRRREVISPSSMYCSQLARCSSWGLLSVSLPSLGAGHACMYKACTKCKVKSVQHSINTGISHTVHSFLILILVPPFVWTRTRPPQAILYSTRSFVWNRDFVAPPAALR